MEIRINGCLAVLKKNTSFDFISENRLFTGSDSYTLTITFPLKGCQQNIDIFGHIHRADVEKSKVVFDCDIRDGSFFKTGTITVTEISETEVKTQFLEGRSEQNYDDTFDDIYINQLDLGYPTERTPSKVVLPGAWQQYPVVDWVPLPWVNNTSGNLQNELTFNKSTLKFSWKNTSTEITFQPYLLYIIKKICAAVGYSCDVAALEATDYRLLLVCNTLPAAWDAWNFAIALPHWTLTEFFEQLEYLLFGEFTINHKAKTVSFAFSSAAIETAGEVSIDKVLDAYTVEVSSEDDSNYLATSNLKYAENDNRYWAYRDCEWYIRDNKKSAVSYDKLSDLLAYAKQFKKAGYTKTYRGTGYRETYTRGFEARSAGNKLYYAKDVDTYFIMFCYDSKLLRTDEINGTTYNWYEYYYRLEPINQFGEIHYSDDASDIELGFVPAWLDDTDEEKGQTIFLECGEMSDNTSWIVSTDSSGTTTSSGSGGRSFGGNRNNTSRDTDDTDYNSGALAQSAVGKALEKGEQDEQDEYFDCIYLGYYDGQYSENGIYPKPIIDSIMTTNDFTSYTFPAFSMRLKGYKSKRETMRNIDPKKKYTFSFLAKEIPDPRALFHIRGGRYICEKLTTTFKEEGMSEKIKGTFFRVID